MASYSMHVIAFILVFVNMNRSENWNKNIIADIIHDLKVQFRSNCIYLLYNAESTNGSFHPLLLNTQKILNDKHNIFSAMISLNYFTKHNLVQCRQNRPLNVIISDGDEIQKSIQQVSTKVYLPDAVWILFSHFNSATTERLNEFFKGIYIPLDTQFLVLHHWKDKYVNISEVYKISRTHSLHTNYFGLWIPCRGILKTDLSFYERRNDLEGIVIKAAAITEPPVTILKLINNTFILEGFFGKIWKILEEKMNFTTEYKTPADQAWGSLTANGTWNGMIGMILKNQVEFAVSEFTMTSLRAGVVDFTIPLIDTRNCVLIRQPKNGHEIKWTSFLEPFSIPLWMVIIIIILTTVICLRIFYAVKLHFLGNNQREAEEMHCAIYIFGAFCAQGSSAGSPFASLRMLYLVAHLTAVILYAAYSGSLVSFLAVKRFSLPFNSLRELIDIRTYKLGVLANSGQLNNFNNASEALMKEVYTKLIEPDKDNLPVSIEEGMQRICDINKYAFMTSLDVVLGLLDVISCELVSVLGASIPESLAISIAKRSPYRGLINWNLQSMRRNGILKKLRMQAWPTKLPKPSSTWETVDFHDTIPFLIILCGGILMGMLFMIVESYLHSRTKANLKNEEIKKKSWILQCCANRRRVGGPVPFNRITELGTNDFLI